MLLALDVHYKEQTSKAIGVIFDWNDDKPVETIVEYVNEIEAYIPGEFYKRELPCLLQVIEKVNTESLEAIIIDGYVFVDNEGKFGLGGMLWEALEKKVPIIGIAKTSFMTNKETVKEVFRGASKNPLFVSSIGCPLDDAAAKIGSMAGEYRMPTVLKELDRLTKQ